MTAECRIGRLRDRFEALVRRPTDVVSVVNGEGVIEYQSPSTERVTGHEPADLVGRPAIDRVHPEDRDAVVEMGRDAYGNVDADADADTPARAEFRIRHADGSWRWLEATASTPVGDAGVDGIVVTSRDVTGRKEAERALRRESALLAGILNTVPDVVYAFDREGTPLLEGAMLDEVFGYGAAELSALGPLAMVPPEEQAELWEATLSVLESGGVETRESAIVTKEGERVPHEFNGARLMDDGEVLGVVGMARDLSDRKRRERRIREQRDELETLNRTNELLLAIARTLAETPTRADAERTVCDRVADSALYEAAWVTVREPRDSALAVRTHAGAVTPGTLAGDGDGRTDADGTDAAGRAAATALRTESVTVAAVEDGGRDGGGGADDGDGGREGEDGTDRDDADDDEHSRSVAAVPLVHEGTTYGVLSVVAARPNAFTARERRSLGTLGELVGFVFNAIETRRLLFADAVVELTFDVADPGLGFGAVPADVDCVLTFDGLVASGDGRRLAYLTVAGAPAADVLAALRGDPDVERGRVVVAGADGGQLELVVSPSSALHAVAEAGVQFRSGRIDRERSRFVLEAAGDVDVHDLVSRVRAAVPGARLVAKRRVDRPVRTAAALRRAAGDDLTERQREVLRAAYYAGYFEWPRDSTAGDLAAAMGVGTTTLHYHLRRSQQKVVAALIDDASSRP